MENPLVSIIVITYNSAKFVLETLESAKAQTYQNIELIISDDGSQDETVNLCKDWLAENKERFVNSQIITVERNTGIPANCNRGVKAAKGEWIKLIAGDDIFLNDGIETVINFTNSNDEIQFVQAQVKIFGDNTIDQKIIPTGNEIEIFALNNRKQIKKLLKDSFIKSPGVFMRKNLIEKVNYFDESFKRLEDFPFWLKVLHKNEKIFLLNEVVVLYRRHIDSASTATVQKGITPFTNNYLTDKIDILEKYRYISPYLFTISILKWKYFLFLNNSELKKNTGTDLLNKLVYKFL